MRLPPPAADQDHLDRAYHDFIWAVFQLAPPGWQKISLAFREVGEYAETEAEATALDGSTSVWNPPAQVTGMLHYIRLLTRSPQKGAWHSGTFEFQYPAQLWTNLDWAGEPAFTGACPAAEYRSEFAEVYAQAQAVPQWLTLAAMDRAGELDRYEWFTTQDPDEEGADAADPVSASVAVPVPEAVLAPLTALLPEGWAAAEYEARVLGSAQEHKVRATAADGTEYDGIGMSMELVEAVTADRTADHDPERGAWLTLSIRLESGGTASLTRDYAHRPAWLLPPPPEVYAEELQFFPRQEAAVPDWLRRRAGAAPEPDEAAAPLRLAEVFDRREPGGRPTVERSGMAADEAERVLSYLRSGALVLTARTTGPDELFPDAPPSVPLSFSTDGSWIWPAAAAYYLERYGMPPQAELLDHIRAGGHAVPEVPDPALAAAREQLTRWIEGNRHRAGR